MATLILFGLLPFITLSLIVAGMILAMIGRGGYQPGCRGRPNPPATGTGAPDSEPPNQRSGMMMRGAD